LAAIPTIFGHTAFNWLLRHLRGQVVGLFYLLAPPLTGIFAWLLWREAPGPGWAVGFIGVALGLVVLALPLPTWIESRVAERG
jgi:drug/metabolite transporter (DMT)-like permease